jgi:hypothetical protein
VNRSVWNKQKVISANDADAGFSANTRLDAIRYKYSSKEESDVPFMVNIFNSQKGAKKVISVQVEHNSDNGLDFKKGFESIVIAFNLQEQIDLEPVKKDHGHFSLDSETNILYWTVGQLAEGDQAVFSFASEQLDFEGMFPLDVKFEETYSILDLKAEGANNAETGEPMSLKSVSSLVSDKYQISL